MSADETSLAVAEPAIARARSVAEALQGAVGSHADGRFVFVRADDELVVTYPEMLRRALALLGALERAGLKPGDPLVIHMRAPEDFVRALWAAFLGGFVACSLAVRTSRRDARGLPASLLRLFAGRPASVMLTSDEPLAETVRAQGAPRVLTLDGLTPGPDGAVRPAASPDEPRLLVLSSGTTGEPNLVTLSDRSVIDRWWPDHSAVDGGACFLAWSPLDHVMGLTIAGPGMPRRVYLPTDLFIERPLVWLDLIGRHGVTNCTSTNFGMRLVLDALARERAPGRWDLRSVKRLGVGAEAVSPALARRFIEALAPFGLDPAAVMQGYGLTECGPAVAGPLRPDGKPAPLGEITAGHAVRIVDADGKRLPEGEAGAIELTGPSAASGYFEDEAATRRLLTPDGWVRTGDLGRLDDGRLTILGRDKEVLFINARKYPCGEVEAIVERTAGVSAAYAAPLEQSATPGRAAYALFVTLADGAAAADALILGLRRMLAERFGAAPAFILPISAEEVPRTGLGKARRLALSERVAAGDFADAVTAIEARLERLREDARVAPSSVTEHALAEMFLELAGAENFGVDDDFFELGGDSLAGVQLLSRIERRFARKLSDDALDGPATIARLARLLDDAGAVARPLVRRGAELAPLRMPSKAVRRLLAATEDWSGVRPAPDSLIFGHNVEGTRRPLFWCGQSDAHVRRLARAMGPDQPIWSLRSGHRAMDYTPENLDALADWLLRDIEQVDGTGPYWFGGYCQGGYVVAPILKKLMASGHEIALLTLLDVNPAHLFPDAPYPGKVALIYGVGSGYNPYRQFRAPELGYAKVLTGGFNLTTLPADHPGLLRPELTRRVAAAMTAPVEAPAHAPAVEGSWPTAARWATIAPPDISTAVAGEQMTLDVVVTNPGPAVWRPTAESGIALANHWLGPNGETVAWLDGWTPLVEPLAPEASVTLKLSIRAPAEPGRYWLELDMVDEGVCWFKERKSRTPPIKIDVVAPTLLGRLRRALDRRGASGDSPVSRK